MQINYAKHETLKLLEIDKVCIFSKIKSEKYSFGITITNTLFGMFDFIDLLVEMLEHFVINSQYLQNSFS